MLEKNIASSPAPFDAEAASYADLVEPARVHSRTYLDAAIFEREMETIFARHWLCMGHEGEIPANGDFRLRKMGRQPVILVRDGAGRVRVLLNRCTHRGNAICQEDRGNAKAFTCAYHGWRFRLNGDLAAVPYPERYEAGFDKSALNLTQARVEVRRGFVFATLNPEEIPLDEHLGPAVLAELDDIADLAPAGTLAITAGVHRTRYPGNWKLQIENAIDGYHANFTHRSHYENVLARTGFNPAGLTDATSPARIRDLGQGHMAWDSRALLKSGTRNMPGHKPAEDVAAAYQDGLVARLGKERTEHVLSKSGSHLFIFPNFIYVGAHFRLIQPVSASETEVQLFPIMLDGAPKEINVRRLRAHEVFYGPAGGGASDDLEIFARNQIGLAATASPWLLLTRGAHLEQQHEDGTVSGQITDELSNRTLWRRWREQIVEPPFAGASA